MKQIFRTAYNIFATICLGIFLLIPVVNIYLLRLVIHQETGIKTDYWKRPVGKDMYGKYRCDVKGCGKDFIYLKNKNCQIIMPCGTVNKEITYLCKKCKEFEFEKLWKIKTLKDIMKIEKEIGANGTVTRTCESDNRKSLNWARYGFEEGIKFANYTEGENGNNRD